MKRLFLLSLVFSLGALPAKANDTDRIAKLEAKVAFLEQEVAHLRDQEARASKYLKCAQSVKGNSLVVPFKILACIRK